MATRRKGPDLDAIEMLELDHKRVLKLFLEFARADRSDPVGCRAIVELATNELTIHAAVEEEIFYPAAREALGEAHDALLYKAQVDHGAAQDLIEQLERLSPDDPYYAPTFDVLGEHVNHHIKRERREIFRRVRSSKLDLRALAAQMRHRKEELLGDVATPGQNEPTAEAEGANEPDAAQALAQQSRRGAGAD